MLKSKDSILNGALEEIVCENLDNLFEELEELSKLDEVDSQLKEGVHQKKGERKSKKRV